MDGLAGAAGIEPANGDTKNRCLTTWPRPKTRTPDRLIGREAADHNRFAIAIQRLNSTI